MRKVIIEPVLNGFKVKVGCSELVFTNIDTLCSELKRYQKNPQEVEKEYQANAINKCSDAPEPQVEIRRGEQDCVPTTQSPRLW